MLLIMLDKAGGLVGGAQPVMPPSTGAEVTLDMVRRYADDLAPHQYLICEGTVEQDVRGDLAGRRSGTWRLLHHVQDGNIVYDVERDGGWREIGGTLDADGHFTVTSVGEA